LPNLVAFSIPDQKGAVLVEVEDASPARSDLIPVSRASDLVSSASASFEEVLDTIRRLADATAAHLSNVAGAPDEVEIELGIKLSGGANIIITNGSAEANLKLKIGWKRNLHTAGSPRA